MRIILLALIILVLNGCITTSKYAVTKPNSKESQTLVGRWSLSDKKEKVYLNISNKNKKELVVKYKEYKDDTLTETMDMEGHISHFNGKRYLNLKVLRSDKKFPVGYLLHEYRLSGNQFRLKVLDSTIVEKAIKANQLKGEIGKSSFLAPILITDSQKNLQHFIRNNPKAFVDIKAVFVRVK